MKRFYSCHKTDKKFPISSSVNLVQGSLGPVHTNPFSNENRAVLLRFQKDLRPHLSFSPVHTTTPYPF